MHQESMGLREYLAIFRARKLLIAITLLVTVAAAVYYSSRLPSLYQSTARVLVQAPLTPGSPQPGAAFINLETERSLATSPAVAEFAADELEEDIPPRALIGGLSVNVSPQTEILEFTYTSPSARIARSRAGAFARGYLDFRRNQFLDEYLAASESVQEQINEVQQELEEVNQDIISSVDETERTVLQTQANALASRLGVLQQQQLPPPSNLRVGQVVQSATLPTAPSSNPYQRNVFLAVVLGLMLGAGLTLLLEKLDDRLRGRHDLESHTTSAVLTVVPRVNGWRRREEAYLASISEPDSAASEAYRTLRTGLLFAASQMTLKKVMITSPEEGEGKTTTTANLGVALARAGKRVVIVSADLRRPRLQRFFGEKSGNEGLTNVLAGEKDVTKVLFSPPGIPNLKILSSGPVPGNPAELLTSTAVARVLAELGDHADFILLDSAPILPVSDALALSRFTDAVLFVADAQKTSRSAVGQARMKLDQVNAKMIGSVLNNFDARKSATYVAHDSTYYSAPVTTRRGE
jgi:polysaccharide biosynthesis transport protein